MGLQQKNRWQNFVAVQEVKSKEFFHWRDNFCNFDKPLNYLYIGHLVISALGEVVQ